MQTGRLRSQAIRLLPLGRISAATMAGYDPTKTAIVAQELGAETGLSDEALVSAVRSGDDTAFETLFDRHKRRVARVAGRFFRSREQIEDVMQESFTKAFFGLTEFAGRREESFAAWITRIAVNACYDELRRARRRAESAPTEVTPEERDWLEKRLHDASSIDNVESDLVSRDLAHKLLARLSADDRLVLILLDAEGLSVAEISEIMGWSLSKVKVRVHRARAHLRKLLKKYL
jgi:RNA polymerase sigma-70 factor (ECF subfamily)